jgi:crotonobetainyl-CoA:carnitine CoA-transferase CaiB-like acyl-CoA transferase
MADRTAAAGSLAGLRVIDLSRVLAGPYCGQLLADHGADVIKVEPPHGDESRAWGPPFVGPGTSAYYAALNRNKRNVVLDLKGEQGARDLDRLLADADVLIENFKTGTLARFGFADAVIAERYPRLVHCRITGYGASGPMASSPGYDAILQAYAGLMSVNGEADGPPLRVGVPVVDAVTGVYAFSGVLLALLERARSGRGQVVDCALLDTGLSLLHPHSSTWLADGAVPQRAGSAHPTIAPYDVYAASDGPVFIGIGNDRQFRALADALGRPELADDPRFAGNAVRLAHRGELDALIGAIVGELDRATLVRRLADRGIAASPIHDVAEALTSPQARHNEMLVELGDYRGVGIPIKLGRTPGSVRTAPRPAGADTDEVLPPPPS